MSDNKEKSDDNTPPTSSETPEVEAEIVTDEDLVDAAADKGEGFVDVDTTVPPPRKSTLTPGVILFMLFAVTALTIFAVWRFQPGRTVPTVDTAASTDLDDTQNTLQTAPAEPVTPTGTLKIANDVAATKITDEALSETSEGVDAEVLALLPPNESATDRNLELLASAKEALLSENDEAADMVDAEDATPAEDVPAFELEPSEDASTELNATDPIDAARDNDVEGVEPVFEDTIIDNAQDVVPLDGPTNADPSAIAVEGTPEEMPVADTQQDTQKIGNDFQAIKDSFREEIAGLEAALAEEREQGVTQRAQIEEMRRNFQVALAARDRTASQQIADLNARLDKIENGGAVEGGRRAAAALALNALRRVADKGEPFANELEVLTGYIPQGHEIATLRRYADTEIPMAAQLEEAFSPAAREALAAAGRGEKTGVAGKLSARVGSLISIRPAEPIAGDSVQAVISRAEAFIETGDIGAGVTELDALVDEPRAAMADWITLAQSRVAVDRAIASLGARLAAPVR